MDLETRHQSPTNSNTKLRNWTKAEVACQNFSSYFAKCVDFIQLYKWIYDVKLTRFFADKAWTNIPCDWLEFLLENPFADLRQNVGYCRQDENKADCSASLCKFIQDCVELSLLDYEGSAFDQLKTEDLEAEKSEMSRKGVKEKKLHEIERFSSLIASLCSANGCNAIVDVGCGLGHLERAVSEISNLSIVGLDSNLISCNKARGNVAGSSSSKAKFLNITIDGDAEQLDDILSEIQGPVSLVSLHGCGDLQPRLLRWLAGRNKGKTAVCALVPCCYHKMSFDEGSGTCRAFPLSECLRSSIRYDFSLSLFGLRLAAQQQYISYRNQTEADRAMHTNHVAFRALLELLSEKGWTFEKKKRRFARNAHCVDFASFLNSIVSRMAFVHSNKERSVTSDLGALYAEYEQYIKYIEPFTVLQALLQGPLESLILADRIMFLRENGYKADLMPLFDANVSPRNTAVVAEFIFAKCQSFTQ